MEHVGNSTASPQRLLARTRRPADTPDDGHAHLYVLVVLCFYAVFLCGIMLGYFRSKRREKRRTNIFTRLLHEEQQREWGALPRKHSLTCAGAASGPRVLQAALPFCGYHGNQVGRPHRDGLLPSPLACALCAEQSSVSSLCSSADTRLTIEEETDGGAEENGAGGSADDSG